MKIIWSPLAIDRVAEIAQYIAQDSPNSAQKWVESIFQVVERLEKFPESGRI
ncbi:MAG: type II toxin-antitoxin system RelE/ParE family toxin, partial [Methyloprofundus sp.]|nr:type II toxin-antitoxin system RelE/ParE family toxin [Methyloprofundus sp.]